MSSLVRRILALQTERSGALQPLQEKLKVSLQWGQILLLLLEFLAIMSKQLMHIADSTV
jgi:hypothetical protein